MRDGGAYLTVALVACETVATRSPHVVDDALEGNPSRLGELRIFAPAVRRPPVIVDSVQRWTLGRESRVELPGLLPARWKAGRGTASRSAA
jgi:hypothetical protein